MTAGRSRPFVDAGSALFAWALEVVGSSRSFASSGTDRPPATLIGKAGAGLAVAGGFTSANGAGTAAAGFFPGTALAGLLWEVLTFS